MQTQSVCDRGLVARREVSVNQAACNSLGSAVHAAIVWASVDGDQSWRESCECDATFNMGGRSKVCLRDIVISVKA